MRWSPLFARRSKRYSDSDLLVHVVDVSNPRVLQQIESVEKILLELKLNEIPQMIVLNKSDLVDVDSLEALKRQISLDKGREIVAVSAIRLQNIKTAGCENRRGSRKIYRHRNGFARRESISEKPGSPRIMSKRIQDLTSPVTRVRKAVWETASRPFRAMSPDQRFWLGFAFLCLLTTILINNPFWRASVEQPYKEGDIARETLFHPPIFILATTRRQRGADARRGKRSSRFFASNPNARTKRPNFPLGLGKSWA